jgi:hypothetical protein
MLDRDRCRQWITLIAIMAGFWGNILANVKPLNGLPIGAVSARYFSEVLIIPANYAFAIWGLIYLGLIGHAIYQALPAQKDHPRLRHLGYGLAITNLIQLLWVVCFQLRWFALSGVAMVGILLVLIDLYRRVEQSQDHNRKQQWLVHRPIRLYLGWIAVATVINIASILTRWGWQGGFLPPEIWTLGMMGVATGLGIILYRRYGDRIFGGVLIWAWLAIALRHRENLILAIGSGLWIVLLLGMVFWGLGAGRSPSAGFFPNSRNHP